MPSADGRVLPWSGRSSYVGGKKQEPGASPSPAASLPLPSALPTEEVPVALVGNGVCNQHY